MIKHLTRIVVATGGGREGFGVMRSELTGLGNRELHVMIVIFYI